jgi:DNA-binding XRE family transcriptional regulator
MRRLVARQELHTVAIGERRPNVRLLARRTSFVAARAPVAIAKRRPDLVVGFLGNVGWRLRVRRKALRRTQREIADRVGITQASLSNYERGKREMTISTMVALCAVLGIEVADLL